MREPTSGECSANAEFVVDGKRAFAAWYPPMGGYVGKCLVFPDANGCFDVYVWHDGDFPIHGDVNPAVLRHCDPEHFIEFGQLLLDRSE